jgi:hypothetical protein
MLNIIDDFKLLYKQKDIHKSLVISFPSIGLTINNKKIVSESFELSESLCSDDMSLVFGSCEGTKVKFTVADISNDLTGLEFNITQLIGDYQMPLGTYVVFSCEKQDDKRFKNIVAFDHMSKADTDVSEWYKALAFPLTLKQFRESLLNHLGIQEETRTLPNDNMTVQMTIEPSTLRGRMVLEACEVINGCFGHMNRYNKFAHIFLNPNYGLYPSETLYPSDNLYPEYGAEALGKAYYRQVKFEEYTVKTIDTLLIRQEDGDIGCMVGEGGNTYIIEDDFLLYGKSTAELQTIATNIYNCICNIPYRPFVSVNTGLPYVELGDPIGFEQNDYIISFVMQRTLSGIQKLVDKYSASGTEEVTQKFGSNNQFLQLQRKTAILKKSVEEVSVTLSDLAEGTEAQFSIINNAITAEVTRATDEEEELSGRITVTADAITAEVTRATDEDEFLLGQLDILAGSIVLKVGKNDIISSINLSPETIKIQSGNIELEGIVTANSYFKILADGSMEARNGKFNGMLISESSMGTMMINGAALEAWDNSNNTTLKIGADGNIVCGHLQCDSFLVDGHQVITTDNIDDQSVAYATNSANSSIAYSTYELMSQNFLRTARISANDNFIPSHNIMYMGSSGSPWAGGFGVSGWITTSDERKKYDIRMLDERYLMFARGLVPMLFKLNDGTSGRDHCGFIAQNVKKLMDECSLSDKEFAGYIASPVYSKHLYDEDGKELPEYDLTSEIIDYEYSLRYEEFIPLLFMLFHQIKTT